MAGMTLKQFARARFWAALDEYKLARESKESERFVRASVALHYAKLQVPRRMWPLVNQAWRGEAR